MKNARSLSAPGLFLAAAVMIALIGVVAVTAGASSRDQSESGPVSVTANEAPSAAGTPEVLGEAEADGLVFMREEEKLARDVYRTLGEIWDTPILDATDRSLSKPRIWTAWQPRG